MKNFNSTINWLFTYSKAKIESIKNTIYQTVEKSPLKGINCKVSPWVPKAITIFGLICAIFSLYAYKVDRDEAKIQSLYLTGSFHSPMLGDDIPVSIESNPPASINSLYCQWTTYPENVFDMIYSSDNHCKMTLRSPIKPNQILPKGWSFISITANVYDNKKQMQNKYEPVFSQTNQFEFNNSGTMISAIKKTNFINDESPIEISIVHKSTNKSLPNGYSCIWNFWGQPLQFISTTENNCKGKLIQKPLSSFSRAEKRKYERTKEKYNGAITVNAKILLDNIPIDLGITEIQLQYK